MWEKWNERIEQFFEPKQPEIYRIPRFISEKSVLTYRAVERPGDKSGWYIGDRRLTDEDRSLLRREAQEYKDSFLWKMMRNNVHYLAYTQATAKRRTDMDAIYAGAMYRDLEILEEFLEQCRNL